MGPINDRRLLLLAAVALAGAAVDSVTAQPGKGPDYFNPKNFNPSMAIVMVVLVTTFFLLGFFSIYLRRCAGPPLGGPDDDDEYPVGLGRVGTGIAYASRRMRGLDRAVLDSFPTMAYADVRAHKEAGNGAALECAVCLTEFDDDDTLRLLPRCAHAFHTDCIDAWLASHVTCPVCRAVLDPAALAAVPATEVIPPVVPVAPPDQADAAAAAASGETETEDQRVRREETAELMRIGSVKRALRSKSGRRPSQFPRSHTTGHSLVAPSHSPSSSSTSDSERYTLRLPDHLLREAVAAGNLRRSASVQTGGDGDGTTTRRAGRSVRLGNSGQWPNMSLLARTFSARLPVWGSARRGDADAPAKGAKFAGDDGKAVEQCDGGACSLGAHV
ncbi:E3 ubiquitin-protein ligase Os03g0188200-like [Miscanthus floridulus]|uniref:E3 ubiquitin-protein ligase Os03g0188200-like n=1 Tax=Miscanthus floridulus TaxID=154761 RepID=UPI0034577939